MKLKELVDIIGGGTPSRDNDIYWNGSIPWVTVKDMNREYIDSSIEFITEEGLNNSSTNLIKKNSILIPTRMGLGRVAINTVDVTINQDLKALVPKNSDVLDLEYLFYFLKSKSDYLKSQGKGATVKGITLDILRELDVPLPSLDIQRQIVKVLNIVYILIQKRQSQITALDELTQSLFLEMFGNPLTNPKEYPLKQLGSLIEVKGGYAFKSKDFIDEGIPVVKIGTANKGYFDEKTLAFLPVIYQEKYEEYLVNQGDLLITLTGTVGKDDYGNICEVEGTFEKYLLNQRVAKLIIKSSLSKYYMYYCFKNKSYKEQLTKVSRGVRQANISNDDIKNLMIPVPPIEDQIKFEEIVIKMKESKIGLLNSLIELDNLYKSLLQKAFKGELSQE